MFVRSEIAHTHTKRMDNYVQIFCGSCQLVHVSLIRLSIHYLQAHTQNTRYAIVQVKIVNKLQKKIARFGSTIMMKKKNEEELKNANRLMGEDNGQ